MGGGGANMVARELSSSWSVSGRGEKAAPLTCSNGLLGPPDPSPPGYFYPACYGSPPSAPPPSTTQTPPTTPSTAPPALTPHKHPPRRGKRDPPPSGVPTEEPSSAPQSPY